MGRHEIGVGPAVAEAMAANQIDVGQLGMAVIVTAAGRGLPAKIVVNTGSRLCSHRPSGAIVAVPLGVLIARRRTLEPYVDPILQILRPIPPIAWTPLAILWFGIGLQAIVFLIFRGSFWPSSTTVEQYLPTACAETCGGLAENRGDLMLSLKSC
jgi:hypothetical protein